jgi:peptidoglycan/xylan/chitin deacetylase (PgdA/CDA1 family)/spore germination protein YaaH/GT2 family glycosyltransferase
VRRLWWSAAGLFALLAAVFLATLIDVAVPPPMRLSLHDFQGATAEAAHRAAHRISRFVHNRHNADLRDWDIRKAAWAHPAQRPLSVAFYAPWDDASYASLRRHIGDVDWVVPHWLSVVGPGHRLDVTEDRRGARLLTHQVHGPAILPMVQNAVDGKWDGAGFGALLGDRAARTRLVGDLVRYVQTHDVGGVMLDFEEFPASRQRAYLGFVRQVRAAFAPHGWRVAVTLPFDDPDWNLAAYRDAADRIFLMGYDEHWDGGTAGPIASQAWFARMLAHDLRQLDPARTILCIGNYGYDWTGGRTVALTDEEAWLEAHDSGAEISVDPVSGNPHFSFDDGQPHEVWLLDAMTAWNQLRVAREAGVGGVALWRLGGEDPSLWTIFGRQARATPAGLTAIPSGNNVDIEGSGEVLKVRTAPVSGSRTITADASGFLTGEHYTKLPLPYVVDRVGHRPKEVALTFDDGPDDRWTPAILDILKAKHAPATFFVVGENALGNLGLLQRIVAEGHEIGNHTWTHPNLDLMPWRAVELELAGTQRLVEAFTGRSMRLFRAPFFGDAEPTTTDELEPILQAQKLGYIAVGLHVDPDDWKGVPAATIVSRVLAQVARDGGQRSEQIVLLHDSGGDRSQTVKALPVLIDALRARGYRIVTVSTLAGLSRDAVMPPIAGASGLGSRSDYAMFVALGALLDGLRWLFYAAIALGILRAAGLTVLALVSARRERRRTPPAIDPQRFVSVLIPAFNEAKVIEASVRRVLASRDVGLEVIVIDDGSKDETSAIVRQAFGDHAQVRLLTLQNGGKARALNRGLALAQGDIVVALDADTQFEPDTIARLARWFADPAVGAVAGNAKVGNRVNLVTRWQALEYVTAQNLERRALAALDAITVVPGAVGAWRASALRQLGGFPADTLAEDQDLTIAVQRAGWRVRCDPDAVAWTEAPDSFRGLARQRFRWSFGTLQCLWKHRAILFARRPRGLGRVGLPQAWLFQIGFAAISPLIDLALLVSLAGVVIGLAEHGWAASAPDLARMAIYWALFAAFDLAAAWTAIRLDRRESPRLLWLLLPQRFGYRQIMYYVVLKALRAAVGGLGVGWGKLDRTGLQDDGRMPALGAPA